MKKKRFSVEQIVAVLKQAELRVSVAELIRKVGTCLHGRWIVLRLRPENRADHIPTLEPMYQR